MLTLLYLFRTITGLILLAFLLRVMLQATRADFYNPISQFIVRVTGPLVNPLRRILPSSRTFDIPSFAALVIVELIVTWLLVAMYGGGIPITQLLWLVTFRLIALTIWTYTICIFVYALLSFVTQAHYSPIAMLLGRIVEPILRPARRILPALGGIDFSPLLVLILLQAISIAVSTSIAPLFIPGLTGLIR